MTLDPHCIFCRILRAEIPCTKVFEDAETLAFMDINPANPGHLLVIPRFHAASIYDVPEPWLAATAATVQRVAKALRAALDPFGLNLVQANGPGAAQSVQHFHWHVLPRNENDGLLLNWGLQPGDMAAIARVAERIRAAL
jgi:histidine triad (HIT) family protein